MELSQRISSFVQLGKFLNSYHDESNTTELAKKLRDIVKNGHIENPWFTEKNIKDSIKAISSSLEPGKIQKWIEQYPKLEKKHDPLKIGVITAGNIPLVGFHDFITVLISGNHFVGKLSSKDNRLLKLISEYLITQDAEFKELITFTESRLENFDAVIATGSNNTSRYFDFYFGKYPHIIRKNRNSVAVLNGTETKEEIQALAVDIFSYFGLGCRNVSKIFFPKDYCFDQFFENIRHYEFINNHNKYANNYDYNKSVYLMNQIQHYDNGFVILKEDDGLSSPIGVVYFQYYNDLSGVKEFLHLNHDEIQCIVSKEGLIKESLPFGKAQQPELWDYADNVDTMKFLINL